MGSKMTNQVAERYFMHDKDTDDLGNRACYFSQTEDEDGWGFWVHEDGSVGVDDTSANGELPADSTVQACVRSAKKWLRERQTRSA